MEKWLRGFWSVLCLAAVAFSACGSPARIALVIGNADYATNALSNTVNDANDMAIVLEKLGFQVALHTNITQRGMKDAIRDFGENLRNTQGVGLFYFSGHGIQYENRNYLLPLDAEIESAADIEYETIAADYVLSHMDEANNVLNIVFLDACRNNPFGRSFSRSLQQGLAVMDAPRGTLIAFATAPNTVAFEGEGRNGIFTKHLLHALRTKADWSITELLIDVTAEVAKETGEKQIPWQHVSLLQRFAFQENSQVIQSATAQSVPEPQKQQTPVASEVLEPQERTVRAKFYVKLYSVPDNQSSKAIGSVKDGERLTVLAEQPEWYKVKSSSGKIGWVAQYQVSQVSSVVQPKDSVSEFAYAKFYARIYSIPEAVSSNMVGSVQEGQRLTILEERAEWYKVKTPDKKVGWIAKYQVEKRSR